MTTKTLVKNLNVEEVGLEAEVVARLKLVGALAIELAAHLLKHCSSCGFILKISYEASTKQSAYCL